MIVTGMGNDPLIVTAYARIVGSVEILATIVPFVTTAVPSLIFRKNG